MSTEEEIKSEVPEASGDVPVGAFLRYIYKELVAKEQETNDIASALFTYRHVTEVGTTEIDFLIAVSDVRTTFEKNKLN